MAPNLLANLLADPKTVLDGNPYRDWIEMYGGEEFQEVSRAAMRQIDRVTERRIGTDPAASPRWSELCHVFTTAVQFEAALWQIGLHSADQRRDRPARSPPRVR